MVVLRHYHEALLCSVAEDIAPAASQWIKECTCMAMPWMSMALLTVLFLSVVIDSRASDSLCWWERPDQFRPIAPKELISLDYFLVFQARKAPSISICWTRNQTNKRCLKLHERRARTEQGLKEKQAKTGRKLLTLRPKRSPRPKDFPAQWLLLPPISKALHCQQQTLSLNIQPEHWGRTVEDLSGERKPHVSQQPAAPYDLTPSFFHSSPSTPLKNTPTLQSPQWHWQYMKWSSKLIVLSPTPLLLTLPVFKLWADWGLGSALCSMLSWTVEPVFKIRFFTLCWVL